MYLSVIDNYSEYAARKKQTRHNTLAVVPRVTETRTKWLNKWLIFRAASSSSTRRWR